MIDKALLSLPGMKKILLISIVIALMDALLIVGQALLLTSSLTAIWYGGALIDQVPVLIALVICFTTRQAIANIRSKQLDAYSAHLADSYRSRLLQQAFNQGPSLLQKQGTGNFTTLLLEGVDQIEGYIRLTVPKLTALFVVPIILLITIFAFDWISGLVGLVVFPAIILEMILIGHTAKIEAGKQHSEYQRLSNHFIDSLRGLDTLNYFGQDKEHSNRIFIASEKFRKATMRTLRVAILSGAVLDAFSTISVAAIAVLLGFRLVDGSITLFPALFVLILAPDYFRPIREFASDYHASLEGKNALASLQAILNQYDESSTAGMPALPAVQTLSFNQVNYSYDSYQALSDISFDARAGEHIGIVGPSGSGKSTLTHLIAGLAQPSEGTITLNDTPVSTLQNQSWQKQVVYLPQNPYIFHASLRDNLTFYQPDAAEEDIQRVIKLMELDELIAELPEGMDTLIGEGERTISGGQAQRIALGRTMLNKDCHVLIFDEPTAHLDIETEYELKSKMLPLMKDKLVFFATHRLHWLANMDRILVLGNHSISDEGTLDYLSHNSTEFRRLIQELG